MNRIIQWTHENEGTLPAIGRLRGEILFLLDQHIQDPILGEGDNDPFLLHIPSGEKIVYFELLPDKVSLNDIGEFKDTAELELMKIIRGYRYSSGERK